MQKLRGEAERLVLCRRSDYMIVMVISGHKTYESLKTGKTVSTQQGWSLDDLPESSLLLRSSRHILFHIDTLTVNPKALITVS